MNKMKKFISVLLAVVMSFGVISVAAVAADDDTKYYDVTFADLPYDISPFRDDYVADYMGYEYGTDYWFTITNKYDGEIIIDGVSHSVAAGTTTDIKGAPSSVKVKEGDTLEFTVSVADYIEPQTVKVVAYATGTAAEDIADLDPYSTQTAEPGQPYDQYYIAKSSADTYGIKPDKNITINVSEYHLFNDCFLYEFPSSSYYTANRVIYNADGATAEEKYATSEWGNTRVVYVNETLYFEVRLAFDSECDLHYDTYEVYYMVDNLGALVGELSGTEKVYLEPVYHYETDEEWVDIYAIENVHPDVEIKITNTVTYTISMLTELLSDFSLENLSEIDLSSIDMSPMLELLLRIVNLVVKMLNGFGLNVNIGDLLG